MGDGDRVGRGSVVGLVVAGMLALGAWLALRAPEPDPLAGAEPGSDAETGPGSDSATGSESESATDSESVTDSVAGSEPESEPESEPDSVAGSEPEFEPGSVARSESESESESEPGPESGSSARRPSAGAGTALLLSSLRDGASFAVRSRAALSLGRGRASPPVIDALISALGDSHGAVRASAARSLGRLDARRATGALERAARDPERPVRRAAEQALARLRPPPAPEPEPEPESPSAFRYYVQVGEPGVRVDGLDPGTAVRLRAAARRQLGAHPDVKLAPGDQGAAAARAVLAAPGTWGYRVDATVVRVEQLPQGLRAEVSAVLQTYPGRDIRAQVRGAATVPGSSDAAARRQAVDAALRSALRQLPGVMARVSH